MRFVPRHSRIIRRKDELFGATNAGLTTVLHAKVAFKGNSGLTSIPSIGAKRFFFEILRAIISQDVLAYKFMCLVSMKIVGRNSRLLRYCNAGIEIRWYIWFCEHLYRQNESGHPLTARHLGDNDRSLWSIF